MTYNTFDNILDMDIEKDKQCIICLEHSPLSLNDHVTLLNNMHFLIKYCDCLCYAHHKCIEKWIATNAVCPICKKIISFPLTGLKNEADLSIDIPLSNSQQSNSQQSNIVQNNCTSHFCIRLIIFLFFVLIILQIMVRYYVV
jgi:hypothetical protein